MRADNRSSIPQGASPRHVVQLVISRATLLVSMGVIAGAVSSVAAGQTARSMLFGLEPYDPATLAFAAFALVATALAASLVPAWRAARLDALAALRND